MTTKTKIINSSRTTNPFPVTSTIFTTSTFSTSETTLLNNTFISPTVSSEKSQGLNTSDTIATISAILALLHEDREKRALRDEELESRMERPTITVKSDTELNLSGKNLEGKLDLSHFPNLINLDCSSNGITRLIINSNSLKKLICHSNQLTSLEIKSINTKMEKLCCSNNNFSNLGFLVDLPQKSKDSLTHLDISDNNIFDRGSLTFIEDFPIGLNNLIELNISNTDIHGGLECVPATDDNNNSRKGFRFYCSSNRKPEIDVKKVTEDQSHEFLSYYFMKWFKETKLDINDSENEKLPILKIMPRKNVDCDQCQKQIRGEEVSYFSDAEKDLDFCSENFKNLIAIGLTPKDADFAIFLCDDEQRLEDLDSDKLTELRKEFNNKIGLEPNELDLAIYFKKRDKNYPIEEREKIEEIHLTEPSLEGELDLVLAIEIKRVMFSHGEALDLTNCEQLDKIECHDNQLINLSLPKSCPNLTELDIRNNILPSSDLSIFSSLTNLEVLKIGTGVKEYKRKSEHEHFEPHKILIKNRKKEVEQGTKKGICNRFYGSLEPLKNLSKLRELDIGNTDINSGWEYLPTSIEKIDYSTWIDFGLSLNDCGFAVYLTKQGYTPQSSFNLEELKEKYYSKIRIEAKKIYLNEPSLEGELDLGDFTYEQGAKVLISTQVNETRLVFRNKPEGVKVIKTVQELNISNQNLEGKLVLNNFSNLKKFNCSQNQLTDLDLTNCEKLEEIGCYSNSLINITLPTNHTKLKKLDLNSNNFPNQDLSFLIPYTNLEELELRNNNFTGSFDYLSNMRQLKRLYISNTDLNEININKLPSNLELIRYSVDRRPDCKLVNIIPQLEKYGEYAKCKGIKRYYGYAGSEDVVLKSLNNSQNMTLDFLTEVINNKLTAYNIVRCHGISQDPVTKNYVMIMDYMSRDIYSFGIIAYELFAQAYPYYTELKNLYPDLENNEVTAKKFALTICNNLRPNIDEIKIPQLLKDLIKKYEKKTLFYQQYQAIKDEYNAFSQDTPYKIQSTTITHSQLINTQQIVQLFQESQEQAIKKEIKKIEREINQPLTDEQKKLVSDFIQTKKLTIQDEANEAAEDKA
nr:13415_t:CDS:10 [Entrophospora candida]